jgi:hypothetical protein
VVVAPSSPIRLSRQLRRGRDRHNDRHEDDANDHQLGNRRDRHAVLPRAHTQVRVYALSHGLRNDDWVYTGRGFWSRLLSHAPQQALNRRPPQDGADVHRERNRHDLRV